MNNFLLMVSWESHCSLMLPVHFPSLEAAVRFLDKMAGSAPEPLQVVALVETDETWFKSKFELAPAVKTNGKEWFRFELALKQFVCTSTDRRPLLQKLVPPTLMEALNFPSIALSPAEKLSIKRAHHNLPAFVSSTEAFVLWAIAAVNEKQDFCISSSIVKHPACIYKKGTIYNALTAACEAGLAQVTIVAGSRVFTLTNAGMERLCELEESHNAAHARKSARSIYGGLL
jgi:hypothetical protein